jgi:hypothetical protein
MNKIVYSNFFLKIIICIVFTFYSNSSLVLCKALQKNKFDWKVDYLRFFFDGIFVRIFNCCVETAITITHALLSSYSCGMNCDYQ